jgi:hypothetical protein
MGGLLMIQLPLALVKDLLSTGYFFEDLKSYPKSKEMDLPTYSRNFLVPYLARISESYEGKGQQNRNIILKLAVKNLSDVNDDQLTDSILGLKKTAVAEIDANEKALHKNDQLDRSEHLSCRQKSESAQSLVKLLVSIIRTFKLVEIIAKRVEESGAASNSAGKETTGNIGLSVLQGV